MLEFIALILGTLIFSWISIINKRNRLNGAHIRSNPSMYILAIPLLIITWFITMQYYDFIFSMKYFFYVILWTIPVIISSYLGNYLLKYKSLLEIRSIKIGFGVLIAIIVDIFYFKTFYNFLSFLAIFLFFLSGYLIDRERINKTKINFSIGILFIFLVAFCDVVETGLYKLGLNFQETIFFHLILAQIILFTVFSLIGVRSLLKDIKENIIKKRSVFLVSILIYVYIILEAYTVKYLPLTILALKGIIPLILFSIFDIKSKEINFNKVTFSAFVIFFIAIMILSFLK